MRIFKRILIVLAACGLLYMAFLFWTNVPQYVFGKLDQLFDSPSNITYPSVSKQNSKLLGNTDKITAGNSFIVAAPVIATTDKKAIDASIGAWFWLQSSIAETPGCEATPIPQEIADSGVFLHFSDDSIPEKDSGKVAKIYGADFIATGRLTGSGEHLTLEYRLHDSDGKPIGNPIAANGGENDIIRALPDLRARLLTAAKIHDSGSTLPLFASVSDAEAIGRENYGRRIGRFTDAEKAEFEALAKRSPLGVATLLLNYDHSSGVIKLAAKTVKVHPYVIACGIVDTTYDAPELDKAAEDCVESGSINYALTHSLGNRYGVCKRIEAGRALHQRAAFLAPKNSYGWYVLADSLIGEADLTRKGQFWDDLSKKEQTLCMEYYPAAESVAKNAAYLAPENVDALTEYSFAADSNSDRDAADTSIKKALALDPANHGANCWALEHFQPKWGGSYDEVMSNLARIKKDPVLYKTMMGDISSSLDSILRLRTNTPGIGKIAHARKEVNADIAIALASQFDNDHFMIGIMRHPLEKEAPEQLEQRIEIGARYLQHNPYNATARSYYASALLQKGEIDDGIKQFQLTVDDAPFDQDTLRELGKLYVYTGAFAQAVPVYTQLVRVSHDADDIHLLAEDYASMGRNDKALEIYREKVKDEPNNANFHIWIGEIYRNQKRYAEAIAEHKKALAILPNGSAHYALGEDYYAAGRVSDAKKEWLIAITYKSGDAGALAAYRRLMEVDPNDLINRNVQVSPAHQVYSAPR